MDKKQFWNIIDGAREEAGHVRDMSQPLLDRLSALPAPEIQRWHSIFDEYHTLSYKPKLWDAAMVISNFHYGEDDFDDFRGWLIAQGKQVFLNALANPDSLAKLETVQAFGNEAIAAARDNTSIYKCREETRFGDIQYVAATAYESKPDTGDFYTDAYAGDYLLSQEEKADIAGEIYYAENMDVRLSDASESLIETLIALRKTFPALYRLFNDPDVTRIQDYDFIHNIRLGGARLIFAEKADAAEPYLIGDWTWNNPFSTDEFTNMVTGGDYLEMMRLFSDRLNGRILALENERAARVIPAETLTADDCVPKGLDADLNGKLIVIKAETLAPEFRRADYQLALATGGFGVTPDARGQTVSCTDLYTGKKQIVQRGAIAGVFPPERLPDWAKIKLALLQDKEVFTYGGYHFKPVRKFSKGEVDKKLSGDSRPWMKDAQYAMRNMSRDNVLGIGNFAGKNDWSHNAFYAASGGSEADIFKCLENGQLYVPGANELFRYSEPPRREKSLTLGEQLSTAKAEAARNNSGKKDKQRGKEER